MITLEYLERRKKQLNTELMKLPNPYSHCLDTIEVMELCQSLDEIQERIYLHKQGTDNEALCN